VRKCKGRVERNTKKGRVRPEDIGDEGLVKDLEKGSLGFGWIVRCETVSAEDGRIAEIVTSPAVNVLSREYN
jgi:hypothetical protein